MTKQSFIIHQSFYEPISYLQDVQLGQLFRALFIYQATGEIPQLEPQVMMAFLFFKNQIDFSDNKYKEICERNKNNGLKGGRPKNPDEPKKPSGFSKTQPNPKNPDEPLREDKIRIDKIRIDKIREDKKEQIVSLGDLSVAHIEKWLSEKRALGKYLSHDPDFILEQFKGYCQANGKTYKDYVAAYKNAFEWEKCQPYKQPKGNQNETITTRAKQPKTIFDKFVAGATRSNFGE